MQRLLLISGPIAVGKSSVAELLTKMHAFTPLRSSSYLKQQLEQFRRERTRKSLQDLGDLLDIETDYQWVIDKVAIPSISRSPAVERWLFDAVRKEGQVTRMRRHFGRTVFHAHFTAPEEVLRARYSQKQLDTPEVDQGVSYDNAISHPNEVAARQLFSVADVVINLQELAALDAASLVVEAMAQGENRDRDSPN